MPGPEMWRWSFPSSSEIGVIGPSQPFDYRGNRLKEFLDLRFAEGPRKTDDDRKVLRTCSAVPLLDAAMDEARDLDAPRVPQDPRAHLLGD